MKSIKKIFAGLLMATAAFGFFGCSDSEEDKDLETVITSDGNDESTSRKVTMTASSEGSNGYDVYIVYTLDGSEPSATFDKDAWTKADSPKLTKENVRTYVDYGTAELYTSDITITSTTVINAKAFYLVPTDTTSPFHYGPLAKKEVKVKAQSTDGITDATAPQTGNVTFKLAKSGNTNTTHYFDTSDAPFKYTYDGKDYDHCYYQIQFSWKGSGKGNWYLYVRQIGNAKPIGNTDKGTNFLARGVYEGASFDASNGTVADGSLTLKTLKGNTFGSVTVSGSPSAPTFALGIDSNTASATGNVAQAIADDEK